jgi:hypothetical protein
VLAHITIAKNILYALNGNKKVKTDYSIGKNKSYARSRNVDAIEVSKRDFNLNSGLILSLSSHECLMELLIIKSGFKKFRYLLCEMEPLVLLMLFKKCRELGMSKDDFSKMFFAGEIGEVIRVALPNTFAHINLDLCQSIITFGGDIINSIKRNVVVVGGTIMITLSVRGVKGTKEKLEQIVAEHGKGNYVIAYKEHYKDGMTMYSMIVRRIR